MLLIKFMFELVHIAETAFTATESEVILGLLALVDLALTGSLIVIVIFSGYENFVSKIDHSRHRDWPEWMGTIDFTALKIKLLASIVAISAIQLLKQFMSITTVSDRDLFWLVVIHVVFVVSSVLLALSDRISASAHALVLGGSRGGSSTGATGQRRRQDARLAPSGQRHAMGRILIVGGYGAFGARAAERLAREPGSRDRHCRTLRRQGARRMPKRSAPTRKARIAHAGLDATRATRRRRCGRWRRRW